MLIFSFSLLSYDDEDTGPEDALPPFRPKLVPGIQLQGVITRDNRQHYVTALSFFKLIFTHELVDMICAFTNKYAEANALKKPSLYRGWVEVSRNEMYRYFGLLFYMAISHLPRVHLYWSTAVLFHGSWARAFIVSKKRFKQIGAFLKVSNFETENQNDKLTKVRFLHEYVRRKCMKLYQPHEQVSIDERMVRNKGRYAFRQYIKDKPTKWGMKIWVIADAITGYTYDFEVYTGKTGTPISNNGLGYDVVMRLMKSIYGQGYKLFIDNYYTSVKLIVDLLKHKTTTCGTVLINRKGIPTELKSTKQFKKVRGAMRWIRKGNLIFLQWQDNKTVSFVSSMHKKANHHGYCNRRTKVNGAFRRVQVRQPAIVKDYNSYMSGVDKSDQLIGKYNSLRKTTKFWKTLFFHFLDIARVNSYIMFQQWRQDNPTMAELNRPSEFDQLKFSVELMQQLGCIKDDAAVPLYCLNTDHSVKPKWTDFTRNCVRCWRVEKIERKSKIWCEICQKYLCFNNKRDCLNAEHEK